jgi:hypothetical protein
VHRREERHLQRAHHVQDQRPRKNVKENEKGLLQNSANEKMR